jgi:hypothetical protein
VCVCVLENDSEGVGLIKALHHEKQLQNKSQSRGEAGGRACVESMCDVHLTVKASASSKPTSNSNWEERKQHTKTGGRRGGGVSANSHVQQCRHWPQQSLSPGTGAETKNDRREDNGQA